MISYILITLQNKFFLSQLFDRIQEGGTFFMFPILMMLLLVFFLIIKSVIALKKNTEGLQKSIKLLNSIGLLAIVWGMLGQLIGLVEMFDQIENISDISPHIFASGLKVSALPPIFGFFVFIVSRAATIIFTWIHKEL